MKRYFLLFRMILGIQVMLAQTPPEPTIVKVSPPSIVAAKFSAGYPNVDPTWYNRENEVYSAEYRVDDTNMGRVVSYDRNGNLLSVENELHNDAYPVSIGAYYVKQYPREKYAVWSFEDATGNKTYYATREQEKIWFDRNGKYLPAKSLKNSPSAATAKSD